MGLFPETRGLLAVVDLRFLSYRAPPPENQAFECAYARTRAAVKFVWGLSAREAERQTVKEMLEKC